MKYILLFGALWWIFLIVMFFVDRDFVSDTVVLTAMVGIVFWFLFSFAEESLK